MFHRDRICAIIKDDGSILTDDTDKANEFNRYFASVRVADNGHLPVYNSLIDDQNCLTSLVIEEPDVLLAINSMKSSLSCPDDLPPTMFKKLKYVIVRPLTVVFNQLLSVAAVSAEWKKAVIIPVLKKGSAGSVTNYRPISLTSVPSKILECVLSRKITEYLLNNNLISDAQHGFLKRRSNCTNLLQCIDDCSLSTELGFQTVVVYIDFAKDFGTVSHSKRLHKLYYYGIRDILLSWFKCF